MNSTTAISIVVPSYNRCDGMLELLESLTRQTYQHFEIIVVDDCSPDNSNIQIANHYPNVTLLKNAHNSGPAISRDKGIRAARSNLIVGLDSDVVIQDPEFLARLMDLSSQNPDVDMFAFKLLTPEGKDDEQRWWHAKPSDSHANLAFDTDYFSGTGYAIKKDTYIKSGGFSHLLYMHYEEVLLAYRLLDINARIVYQPMLCVLHNALPTERRHKMKMFYKPRNQLIIAASVLPLLKATTYLLPRLGKNFIVALKHGELRQYFRAFNDFKRLRHEVFNERKVLKQSTFEKLAKLRN